MKKSFLRNSALLAAATLLVMLGLTACGGKADDEAPPEPASDTNVVQTTAGGSVFLPHDFTIPVEAGSMSAVIDPVSGMAGAFTLIRNRTTDYFAQSGTLTLNFSATMFALANDSYAPKETKHQTASAALWKKGEGTATYVSTAFFKADGTTQTAVFEGLDSAAEYRIAFNYSDYGSYRMSGSFNIGGVTSSGETVSAASDAD